MQKWEYKILNERGVDEKKLSELGNDGWELVVGWRTEANPPMLIFKRPKS